MGGRGFSHMTLSALPTSSGYTLVSQASRIFPRAHARVREGGGGKDEEKYGWLAKLGTHIHVPTYTCMVHLGYGLSVAA